MDRLAWVCVGGAFGSGARYLVSGWVLRLLGASFPFGTLTVNVVGSFLLGLLMHVGISSDVMSPNTRLALTTGAMGGFTTYSTFSYESLALLREGVWPLALANVAATVLVCLLATAAGLAVGRWLLAP